jgi:hypothetical protein
MSIEICKNIETECSYQIVPCNDDDTTSVQVDPIGVVNPIGSVMETINPRFQDPTWYNRPDEIFKTRITYNHDLFYDTINFNQRDTNNKTCFVELKLTLPYFEMWVEPKSNASSYISMVRIYGSLGSYQYTTFTTIAQNFTLDKNYKKGNPLRLPVTSIIKLVANESYCNKKITVKFDVFLRQPRTILQGPISIKFPAINLITLID